MWNEDVLQHPLHTRPALCCLDLQIHSDASEDFLLINPHGLLECLREIPLIIACGLLTLARVTAQAWVRCEQPLCGGEEFQFCVFRRKDRTPTVTCRGQA